MQQESPISQDSQRPSPAASKSDRHDAGPARITRKSHRKSRSGCDNCKQRRIKCDEAKPECTSCKRRQVRCKYTVPADGYGDSSEGSGGLRVSEIELTFHWTTSTCHTLSTWSSGTLHWQQLLADVGLDHNHVLHLMFAFTALHLASCRPNRRAQYTATADYHYACALALVTPELAGINPDNCDALFTSVQLICFVSWARGPRSGDFLAFGENGKSEWLTMFRGVRTTLESLEPSQFAKTHAPAVRAKSRPLVILDEPEGYVAQLEELREHIACTSEELEYDDNICAIDMLRECYSSRYGGKDSEYHVVFSWLYRMSDTYLERLQQHHPLQLIIYAHFVVLMHEMERFWYMKGWTHHIMSGIFEALPKEHMSWIRWPAASIGWIEP